MQTFSTWNIDGNLTAVDNPISSAADVDPLRTQVRQALETGDQAALEELACPASCAGHLVPGREMVASIRPCRTSRRRRPTHQQPVGTVRPAQRY
jgi:hypothetical protein